MIYKLWLLLTIIHAAHASLLNITFDSSRLAQLTEDTSVNATIRINHRKSQADYNLNLVASNDDVIQVSQIQLETKDDYLEYSFNVEGIKLGITKIDWTVSVAINNRVNDSVSGHFSVSVIRKPQIYQTIFTIVISIAVMINNINMGCLLDLKMIAKVIKKPIAPIIGFCSQFIFMPLGSYLIGYLCFPDNISWRIGLFVLGCSPGGTGSNFWTLLWKGDVDLSVTMTFVSTLASLGMLPLWLFTLGSHLLEQGNVTVPYLNLFISLFALIVPLAIGLALQKYKTSWALYLRTKVLKPFTVVVIIISVGGGILTGYYVFELMTWSVLAAGFGVAAGGYLFGAILAAIFGLRRPQIIAVSIETALQNPAIAFVLLQLSLGQPHADLAAVPIVSQLLMTSIPMCIVYAIYKLARKAVSRDDDAEERSKPRLTAVTLRGGKVEVTLREPQSANKANV
ncbi:Ileal sodium/bile acid cotransporter [Halotydeus destructor]|nr:Ileal sodium/bile acid cotransporter [Halotydeus destructor]